MTLLIRDATIAGALRSILIHDDRIAAVEPTAEAAFAAAGMSPDTTARSTPLAAASRSTPPARAAAAARVIDAAGLHAFPSLKNGHTHVAMALFRGYGDDMPLMDWLRTRIWPAEQHLTADDVYHGARLGILEMIRGGTTFLNEMYWFRAGIVRAAQELGVRALAGVTFLDTGDPAALAHQREEALALMAARAARTAAASPTAAATGAAAATATGAAAAAAAMTAAEAGSPAGSDRVQLSLAPHSIYMVPPPVLEWIGGVAREHDLIVHIHLSETTGEVEECVRQHGCRPAQLLERCGLLGPNLIAAHGVFLDDRELELLGAAGATVVTNPTANMKLATGGIFPYRAARSAGVRVCLGTDGAASNNNLDMLEEMKLAALVQKHRERDATALPASEALAMATTAASAAFRLGAGTLEPGALADIMLVDLAGPATQPLHDPTSALVYAASAGNVHTTICAGRVLMHDRRVEVCDEREVIDAANDTVRRLLGRAHLR